MTTHQSARHRRELAASDGFDSLHKATPNAAGQAFMRFFNCRTWWTAPPPARRVPLVTRMLRRIRERRRVSAVERA